MSLRFPKEIPRYASIGTTQPLPPPHTAMRRPELFTETLVLIQASIGTLVNASSSHNAMFNEERGGCMDSPTGHIVSDPADLLNKRYRRGNPESVRQLSVRVRVAEEEIKKYRLQNDELKKNIVKMSKELEQKQCELKDMQRTFEQHIDELQQKLSKKEREEKQNRFETLMSIFRSAEDSPKSYEPPFAFLDESKPVTMNSEAQTDDWMLRPIRKSIDTASAEVAGPSVASKPFMLAKCDDINRYEKLADEVAKLENEKFFLTTQLRLTKSKLENFELQEAQKTSLENRLLILTEMNECLVKENERLKEVFASKVTVGNESSTMEDKRKNVDIILESQAKLDAVRAELDLKSKQLQEQVQINRTLSANLESVKEQLEAEKRMDAGVIDNGEAVLKRYEDEIRELKNKLAEFEKAPAASTKILHMKINPLDVAHQEYKEFQAERKRKMSESSSFLSENGDFLDVAVRKKQRCEMKKEITDLQFQLHKVEKEKERALKIQSNLVKKYRAIVTALSGLQIKMKEDEMVQVESIFDPGKYFIFKVHDYGKTISLLETDYAMQWTAQIREYLEGRHSTPAFLAAITLMLDEQAESTTPNSFYSSD